MGRYLLKRLGMTVLVVLVVMSFLSLLVHLVPGDPVTIVLGTQATASQIALVREEMGFDNPIYVQVWDFVVGALQGDLGRDFLSRTPVTQLILDVMPHTAILAVTSLALASLVGIPLGVFAARHQNSLSDRIIGVVSVSFVAMPSYVVSLLLLVVFAVKLQLFPAVGAGSLTDPVDYAQRLILPSIALALTWIGYVARLVRTSMLSVLGSNYIRTARAFGVPERVIFRKGALKNAIVPTVAVLSSGLANLLGGAVIVEIIFSRPGLGRLTVEAIAERNFPIVQGAVLVIALIYVITNLLADISYRWVDPRIRVEENPTGA
jgi:peptide/nickel transport system permease protein